MVLIIHQKKRRQKTKEDKITTEEATIATNENCRCRNERAKDVKNNILIRTVSMVNNQLLSKITRETHNNKFMAVTSLISDTRQRYKRKCETNRQYSYKLGPVTVALIMDSAMIPKRRPKTGHGNI